MADGRAGVRDLVIAGDVGGVRAWLDAGGDPDQTDPATNQTLLMAAAFEGRLEVVRLLLGRGAGREGALFAAVLGRRGEVARELLPLGWDRGELRQAARVHREVSEAVPEADEELGRLLRSAWRAAEREPDA